MTASSTPAGLATAGSETSTAGASSTAAVHAPLASAVLSTPPAPPSAALTHFRGRLAFEADVSDVHADLEAGFAGFVLVDSRSTESWEQGHIPHALHLPTSRIKAEAAALVPRDRVVVTYCWGPGCNGATKAALALAGLGFSVREMIGGFEYWAREGLPVDTDHGVGTREPDPLTVALSTATCDC
jgi:rhodanese-related sulfurtransferase